jgi:hypothetical protein
MASGNRDNAGTVLGSLIHWLTRWEKSANLRWSRLCARMLSESIEPSIGLLMIGKSGLKLKLGGDRGILVEVVPGNAQSLLEYARSAGVSTAVLTEIRNVVRDSIEGEEKRIDELIAAVPQLIEDFRCDVAEEHLEQEAMGTSDGSCKCSHPHGLHPTVTRGCLAPGCGCMAFRKEGV